MSGEVQESIFNALINMYENAKDEVTGEDLKKAVKQEEKKEQKKEKSDSENRVIFNFLNDEVKTFIKVKKMTIGPKWIIIEYDNLFGNIRTYIGSENLSYFDVIGSVDLEDYTQSVEVKEEPLLGNPDHWH